MELIDMNGFIGNEVYQTNLTYFKKSISSFIKIIVSFYKAFSLVDVILWLIFNTKQHQHVCFKIRNLETDGSLKVAVNEIIILKGVVLTGCFRDQYFPSTIQYFHQGLESKYKIAADKIGR